MVIKGFSQDLGKGFGMRGQLIAWGVTKPFDSFQSQIGARYFNPRSAPAIFRN
jgi:hypothetical protein